MRTHASSVPSARSERGTGMTSCPTHPTSSADRRHMTQGPAEKHAEYSRRRGRKERNLGSRQS